MQSWTFAKLQVLLSNQQAAMKGKAHGKWRILPSPKWTLLTSPNPQLGFAFIFRFPWKFSLFDVNNKYTAQTTLSFKFFSVWAFPGDQFEPMAIELLYRNREHLFQLSYCTGTDHLKPLNSVWHCKLLLIVLFILSLLHQNPRVLRMWLMLYARYYVNLCFPYIKHVFILRWNESAPNKCLRTAFSKRIKFASKINRRVPRGRFLQFISSRRFIWGWNS